MDGGAFVNMLHFNITTDCICNEAMKFSTRTSNVAIYAVNTFDGRQAWNIQPRARSRVMEIQIPCGASSAPVVCFSRGCACNLTCMMHHCRTKWTAFMGPIHSLRSPPVVVVGRACAEGRGNCTEGPRGRERESASALLNNVGF